MVPGNSLSHPRIISRFWKIHENLEIWPEFRPRSEKLCAALSFSKVNGCKRYSIRNSRKDILSSGPSSEISTFTTEFEKTKRMCSQIPFSCGLTCGVFPSDFVLLKEQNSLLFSYLWRAVNRQPGYRAGSWRGEGITLNTRERNLQQNTSKARQLRILRLGGFQHST